MRALANWPRSIVAVQGPWQAIRGFEDGLASAREGALSFVNKLGRPGASLGQRELAERMLKPVSLLVEKPYHVRVADSLVDSVTLEELSFLDMAPRAVFFGASRSILKSGVRSSALDNWATQMQWGSSRPFANPPGRDGKGEPVAEPQREDDDGLITLRFSLVTRDFVPFEACADIARGQEDLYCAWTSCEMDELWEGPEGCWAVAEAFMPAGGALQTAFTYILPSTPKAKVARLEQVLGHELTYTGDGKNLSEFEGAKEDEFAKLAFPEPEQPFELDPVLTEDFWNSDSTPKGHKPLKSMVNLVSEAKDIVEQYDQLLKRVEKLNAKMKKMDPQRDIWTARELKRATMQLNQRIGRGDLYSVLGLDPWERVAQLMEQAVQMEKTGRYQEAEQIMLGLGGNGEADTVTMLDNWKELMKVKEQGYITSSRAENYVYELQQSLEDVLSKMGIEPPFPNASPDYW